MKAGATLAKASELVGTDRSQQHGPIFANHTAIAELWNGYLSARSYSQKGGQSELDAADVANMMELLKVARRLNGAHNDDDYVDAAGYAAIAGEIASEPMLTYAGINSVQAASEPAIIPPVAGAEKAGGSAYNHNQSQPPPPA